WARPTSGLCSKQMEAMNVLNWKESTAKVVLAYKNFAANKHISHIGLGVSAINIAKMLRRHGLCTEVWPIVHARDLADRLKTQSATHVVVSAPWISSNEFQQLTVAYPNTRFTVN